MSLAIPEFADEIDSVREVLLENRNTLARYLADAHDSYPHTDLSLDHEAVQALTQAVDLLAYYAAGYR